jgi:putative MATE family efflux protein
MSKYFSDKQFLRALAFLAVPIMLNELLNSSVNMLDTFMIGTLGDAPVAAVGLGNQLFFLFTLISFGINSGTAIFMGQFMGKNDINGVHRTIGLSLLLNFTIAVILALAAFFIPETIMGIYSKDSEVIALGCDYLKTVAVSYIFTAVVIVFNSALKVTGNTLQPMLTTFIAFIINFIGNYIFIIRMGFGIKGAALSTLIARSCELVILLTITAVRKRIVLTSPKNYFKLSVSFCKPFIAISLPVVANETLWSLGTSAYNIAYKFSGTTAQAAIQIASTVQNLFLVAGMGIGSACAILLSNTLGAGDKEKALDYSQKCIFFGVIISVCMGCILALTAPFIVSIFRVDALAKDYAYKMLLIVSGGVIIKTLAYITICGILRSGGDTKFCLILESCSVWLIGLPLAFLGSAILSLPIYITFAMVYTEEIVKTIIAFKRVSARKWLRTLV